MSGRLEAAVAELVYALREELRAEAPDAAAPDRLLSIDAAAETLGIGRSALYGELAAGRLRSLKIGRRRLISSSALAAYTEMPAPVIETTGSGQEGRRRDRRSPAAA